MFFFVWNVPLTDENGWGSQRIASGKAVAKNKGIVRCVNQRMWDENSMLVFFQVVILFPFHSRLEAWSFSMTLCRSYSWIQKHILDIFPLFSTLMQCRSSVLSSVSIVIFKSHIDNRWIEYTYWYSNLFRTLGLLDDLDDRCSISGYTTHSSRRTRKADLRQLNSQYGRMPRRDDGLSSPKRRLGGCQGSKHIQATLSLEQLHCSRHFCATVGEWWKVYPAASHS